MAELKRCPFCGDRVGYFGYDLDSGICLVSCNGCSAKIEAEAGDSVSARNAATESWNRRTPDYRALAQQLATALVKAEALTREAYTFHHAWYMGTIPPGQLNGDASWAAYELATWHRRAHQEIEPALAAAKETGVLPEVKA